MRHSLMITALAVIGLGSILDARAEVRAITDRNGNYRMTRVLTPHSKASHRVAAGERIPGVWRPVGRTTGPQTLNADGDRLGDLWPTIAEARLAPRVPWVLWSRLNGADYDLAWSRWPGSAWAPVQWLAEGISGDDLDPDVEFDADGRPYVTWWVEHDGRGTVFFSLFLETRWMAPLRVSDVGVDARYPRLSLHQDGPVIGYRTTNGVVEYSVQFNRPATITDDINPLEFYGSGASVHVSTKR